MSERDVVEVERAALRRMVHRYNNLTSRVLTLAEVALLGDDPRELRSALEAIVAAADDLASFTRSVRSDLLGED